MRLPRNDRMQLLNFYSQLSSMTYTGTEHTGLKQISDKIESLSFETMEYSNMNFDVQNGPLPGSILVFVNGFLKMDGSDEFRFAQVFNICPNNQGGYYVHNDIFSVIV